MKNHNNSSFTILTLLFLFSAALAIPSSWPYFHPNSGQTSIIVPEQIDTSWQANLGDSVYIFPTTSPVIGWINDREAIFIPTSSGVWALDAIDGHTIWTYPTTESLKYAPLYLDSAHLCASVGDSLICLDPQTGAKTWSYSLNEQGFHVVGLANRFGVVTENGEVFVFDHIPPGDSAWHAGPTPNSGGCVNTSLVQEDQSIYLVTLLSGLYPGFTVCKFSLAGQLIWSDDEFTILDPGGVQMTPGLRHHHLYFGTHVYRQFFASRIFDYNDSTQHCGTYPPSGFSYPDGPVLASPGIDSFRGNIYFPTANFLWALDSLNNPRWTYSCQLNASSPAIDGNHRIIFGTADGHLLILNSGGIAMHDFVCDGDLCSPAIGSDGSVYIAGANSVYKFGAQTGQGENGNPQPSRQSMVYPNPFSQRLTINSSSDVGIYSLDGRQVFAASRGSVVWQPVGLPSGVYLVKAGRQILKVVKD